MFYPGRSALCWTSDVHMWKTRQDWDVLDVMYGLLVQVQIQVYNLYTVKPVIPDRLDPVHAQVYQCNRDTGQQS